MNAPTNMDDQKVSETPIFEPFPEPQTMPKGWDFSGILPEPTPVTAQPAESQTEI